MVSRKQGKTNHSKVAPLKISLTIEAREYLDQLVATGIYGKTPTAVAEGLIMGSLQSLLKDGTVKRSPVKEKQHDEE